MDFFRVILIAAAALGLCLVIFSAFAWVRWPHVQHGSSTSLKAPGLELSAGGALGIGIIGLALIIIALSFWNKGSTDSPSLPDSAHPPTPPVASPTATVSAPPAPVSNEPPPTAVKVPISPQEAATQLAVWESVRSNRNGLVEAYNLLDGTLAKWEAYMDDANGRKSFTDGMRNVTSRLKDWFPRLDALKNEYPQFQDLTAAMANSHVDRVLETADAFVDAVADSRQETNEARLLRLRPLEGALRAEMGGMVNWLTALGRTSEQRIHDLSGVK